MPNPDFSFCGYPIPAINSAFGFYQDERLNRWQPCGAIATPGCAYCEEHAQWPEPGQIKTAKLRDHYAGGPIRARGLSEEEIIARVTGKTWWKEALYWLFYFSWLALMTFFLFHLPFPWTFWGGVLVGSVVETLIIIAGRWTWHRINWVHWFSR